jgi:hypothetical protein
LRGSLCAGNKNILAAIHIYIMRDQIGASKFFNVLPTGLSSFSFLKLSLLLNLILPSVQQMVLEKAE